MKIILYHNPHCSKSRETLSIIRAADIEPRIISYLDQPPTREALLELLALLRIPVSGLMRTGDVLYAELGLDDPDCDDAQRLETLIANPALFNRPVAVSALGARVCRPPETVLEILPNKDEFNPPQVAYMKSTLTQRTERAETFWQLGQQAEAAGQLQDAYAHFTNAHDAILDSAELHRNAHRHLYRINRRIGNRWEMTEDWVLLHVLGPLGFFAALGYVVRRRQRY